MGLNKSQGNMYPWITHTWNPIRGRCPHLCDYCYMKRIWDRFDYSNSISLNQKALKTKLGHGKKIFVGSSIDMWANDIPETYNLFILAICQNYSGNEYLFQTKNPQRLYRFKNSFPPQTILGVTLESNREYPEISKAPSIADRVYWLRRLREESDLPQMISLEPILDFDLEIFAEIIESIRPSFVSIGADSKGHHLSEPSLEKIGELLLALKKIRDPLVKIKIKDNLKRLL